MKEQQAYKNHGEHNTFSVCVEPYNQETNFYLMNLEMEIADKLAEGNA